VACEVPAVATLPLVGDEQKISWQELLANSQEAFDDGTDFTVAVEEEFALLDPETLELTDRFEEVYAAALETELAPNIVGELIASEVEVRTGRCENFAEAAAAMQERRSQIHAVARDLQLGLGGTATHPWSRWQDQRIIDTPHYRRNDEILRYVVWRNNTFGLHVHVGIAGADRAIAVHDALRTFLPEVLALSASSPFVEAVNSGLHSARTEIFTRMFPRCGIPDPYGDWQGWEDYVSFLYRTGSVTEHTQIWWSVRPHLAFPTIEIRIADGQPDLAEAQSLAAFAYSLAVRCARAIDEGETIPSLPNRLLEENLWRAIRYGLSGELLDLERGEPVHARRRLEDLLDWVAPVADEIGAAPYLAIPERNAAERQIARFQEGASIQEIYAEQVQAGEPIGG
jgi:glutamate---cysteine ligase / carboxylate-amine ligase